MKITVGSTYHTIGTGNLVIGVMKKMGHSSLEEICIPSPLWPGPNKEITSTKVLNYSNIVDMTTSDKICVVLIRDVFDILRNLEMPFLLF